MPWPGDDVGIVEGGHERGAALRGEPRRDLFAAFMRAVVLRRPRRPCRSCSASSRAARRSASRSSRGCRGAGPLRRRLARDCPTRTRRPRPRAAARRAATSRFQAPRNLNEPVCCSVSSFEQDAAAGEPIERRPGEQRRASRVARQSAAPRRARRRNPGSASCRGAPLSASSDYVATYARERTRIDYRRAASQPAMVAVIGTCGRQRASRRKSRIPAAACSRPGATTRRSHAPAPARRLGYRDRVTLTARWDGESGLALRPDAARRTDRDPRLPCAHAARQPAGWHVAGARCRRTAVFPLAYLHVAGAQATLIVKARNFGSGPAGDAAGRILRDSAWKGCGSIAILRPVAGCSRARAGTSPGAGGVARLRTGSCTARPRSSSCCRRCTRRRSTWRVSPCAGGRRSLSSISIAASAPRCAAGRRRGGRAGDRTGGRRSRMRRTQCAARDRAARNLRAAPAAGAGVVGRAAGPRVVYVNPPRSGTRAGTGSRLGRRAAAGADRLPFLQCRHAGAGPRALEAAGYQRRLARIRSTFFRSPTTSSAWYSSTAAGRDPDPASVHAGQPVLGR